ncbi:aminopeptidase N [Owenweeksia hongkongensis DSM 17368]|uniref:Aminopeptidase N n=1 Tax=Owenweeksia hongkongensis (strain DSM 17368 / CIP 108786 / JCM 12287 / NRRL B-23963 / UST20020801) TaxID=926562 RepID=G8R2H4_OWEHD|nr:M1 family metallopeptidase [Owenweeksia hongkongensis]AEV33986.1 aminopeptidase N [Owenweeksia hongkongensis DSM 17368]
MKIRFCFLFLLGAIRFLIAQSIDFTHLHVSLELDTNKSAVYGKVQLAFKADTTTDSIYLNGVNMEFEKVTVNNAEVKYASDNKGIWLWPEELLDSNSISIKYTAHPRRGMFFIGWNDETGLSRRQVWTQGQGIDNRHWVPHFDEQTDKLITEIEVLFDSKYEVISNGSLVSKEEEGDQIRWHYKMAKPHSSYLMMLAIGKYALRKTVSKSGVSLWQYYYPDREEDYKWYYYKNEEIFNFLEKEIGVPYPWENYKQVPVQDFQHGAMENTTATIFGDFFLVDEVAFNDRNYTYVNAHELAHQWFGNLVTATGSDEHWLHEGFATYYQWLSEKHLYGQDFFDWERYKAAQMVFEASKIDTVPLGSGKAGSARFYQKGAWVLYMLSESLGKEKFDKVIKYYLEQNAFGLVTTDSLNSAIQQVAGTDYSYFFQKWVYSSGEPAAKVTSKVKEDGVMVFNHTSDSYLNMFFDMKLAIEGQEPSKNELWLITDSASTEFTSMPGQNHRCKYWIVNPNMHVLADITENKPIEYLQIQYEESLALLDRYYAVRNAEQHSLEEKETFLIEVTKNESEFFSVRAEALKQLVEANYPKSDELLLLALQSKDVQLQKEAIKLVKNPEGKLMKAVAELRKGDSYELRESAINTSIAGADPKENAWLNDEFWMENPGVPDNKIAVVVLLYRTAIFQDKEALQDLIDYTSSGYDFLTRINAMQALGALQYFDDEVAANYFDALFSLNRTLSRNARQNLNANYSTESGKEVIDKYVESQMNVWDDFQKRLVNRTFGLNLE